jgi:uncharacterized protein YaaN involved in tellurite resistance
MTKTLNVIKPFMHLVPGDTFELNEDGSYTAKQHDEFTRTDDSGDFKSSLISEFTVSADYMKEMAEEGIVDMDEPKKPFVNVFNEIDKMLNTYTSDLKNIDTDMDNVPECLKVEKTTVLKNLIKTLNHLKNLRK